MTCTPFDDAPGFYWLRSDKLGHISVAQYRGRGVWRTYAGYKSSDELKDRGYYVADRAVPPTAPFRFLPRRQPRYLRRLKADEVALMMIEHGARQ